jgi:hypothetical protein
MDYLKDLVAIATGVVALLTFLIGLSTFIVSVREKRRQGRQKRFELYLKMESKFQGEKFREIRALLNKDDKEKLDENKRALRATPKRTRRDFAAFFESIALMRNSGLITKEVACNMFSHDAIECWYSDDFWHDFKNKDVSHWGALRLFAEEMAMLRPKLKTSINRRKLSF